MDMSKYIKIYVGESQERLQRMDSLLLTLEQNGADRPSIDTLFREAHSIKGMSASMGYDELAKVAHRMEDYLDKFRGGKGALDRQAVDVLFEGVDLLRRAVEEIAAGGRPSLGSADYLGRMAALLLQGPQGSSEPPPASAPPPPPPPTAAPAEPPPAPAGSPDVPQFTVEVQIAPDAPLPSARAYITLRRVRDLGALIRSAPTLEQVQAGQFTGTLSMLITSARSTGEIQAFMASLPDVASVLVRPVAPPPPAEPERTVPPPAPAPPPPPEIVPEPPAPPLPGVAGPAVPPHEPPPPVQPAPPVAPPAPPPEPVAAPPVKAAEPPAAPHRPGPSMTRIDTRLLDDLMDQVGELMTAQGFLVERSRGIESLPLHDSVDRVDSLIRELQQQAMKLRMIPLEMIADRFPRAVRDLARKRGKEVQFEVVGKETELDRAILEELPDPLLHIFRNSIDHGIEPTEERVRNGKPPAGTIRLVAAKERESVMIRVEDDGRGMDPVTIRKAALERGVLSPQQSESMTDAEVLHLITIPGFSTAKEVSDVSGRGVGMDVVKSAVEALRGTLQIESVPGQGSSITLKLPLTLAVVAVLLVEAAGERYALPASVIAQVVEVGRDEIQHAQGRELMTYEEELVPLLDLGQVLGCPPRPVMPFRSVVLVEMRGRLVGLSVDRLIGYREVVVKSLGRALKGLRGVAGVTILGDGGTVLILDPNTL